MLDAMHRFARDTRGADGIEYGLIASLIVVAILVGITAVGDSGRAMWAAVSAKFVENM